MYRYISSGPREFVYIVGRACCLKMEHVVDGFRV